MIPTLLLAGMVVGWFVRSRAVAPWLVLVTVLLAFFWGVAVGTADGTVTTGVGGFVLGLANLSVGAVVCATARQGFGRVLARARPSA